MRSFSAIRNLEKIAYIFVDEVIFHISDKSSIFYCSVSK